MHSVRLSSSKVSIYTVSTFMARVNAVSVDETMSHDNYFFIIHLPYTKLGRRICETTIRRTASVVSPSSKAGSNVVLLIVVLQIHQ